VNWKKNTACQKLNFQKWKTCILEFLTYISQKMLGEKTIRPRDSVLRLTDLPINDEPGLMNQYTGWLKFESGIYKFQSDRYLTPLKNLAIELLTILKEEYRFK